ncbi:MAG: sensor histidine kinase [Limisphaerales bacterium]
MTDRFMPTNHSRPSVAISVVIYVAAVGLTAYFRLYLFPQEILSLSYGLPLFICILHRDRILLWALVVTFVVMSGYKMVYLLPDPNPHDRHEFFSWVMHVANILVIGGSVHAILNLTEKLHAQNANLEQRVQERTADLQESLAELQRISYAITHDMRAPLRALQGFASIIDQECHTLDDSHRQMLRRIGTAANRMDKLITDALVYTDVVRQEMNLTRVDCAKLLKEMIQTYPAFQPAEIEIDMNGDFPMVSANEAGLTQCFSMLLSNAIKSVKAGQRPKVRIRTEVRDQFVRFWFEDNGRGITPEMLPRIFDIFQQDSGPDAGAGIGLAICRKIIERLKGRIGVESEPGQGSRFWLDLKRAD